MSGGGSTHRRGLHATPGGYREPALSQPGLSLSQQLGAGLRRSRDCRVARTGPGLAPQPRGAGEHGERGAFPAALQMWFSPSAERAKTHPDPLAGFQGKEEGGWLGGAGSAAFKMPNAQSLRSPPGCWGGSAHAGGLLPTPAAPPLPPTSAGSSRETRQSATGAPRGVPAGPGRDLAGGAPPSGGPPPSGGDPPSRGGGGPRAGAAGPAGRAVRLVVTHAGTCLPGSLPGFFAYQPKDFLVFNYRLRILLQKGAVGIMREDSG